MQVTDYSRKASHRGATKTAFRYADLDREPEKCSSAYSYTMEKSEGSFADLALHLRASEKFAKQCVVELGFAPSKVCNVFLA